MVRILMQTLENLGFELTPFILEIFYLWLRESASILSKESGVALENDLTLSFRKDILTGSWEKSFEKLHMMNLPKDCIESITFMIYEQKYLESIEAGNINDAVLLLRNHLKTFCKDTNKLHKLASLVMCKDSDYLSKKINWEGNLMKKRNKLLANIKKMNKSINMLETDLMDKLLKQAISYQILCCKYHTNVPENFSLLQEHKCDQEMFPNKCYKTLTENTDEVWIVKFSNDGSKLASISKNHSLIMWEFNHRSLQFSNKPCKKDSIHAKDIHCLIWSPDDAKLLTTSADQTVKIWSAKNLDLLQTLKGHSDIVCGAVWHPSDGRLFTAGIDNIISVWQNDQNQIEKIKTNRISDLLINSSGKYLYALCAGVTKISIIELKSYTEINQIIEKDFIISAEISRDGKYMLLNTSFKYPEIHKWDLETLEIVQIFSGHTQEKFMLRCGFGGCANTLIASGSEDGKVYIWHKNSKEPITALEGHSMTINSVSWNSRNPYILASASDDNLIKVWINSETFSSISNPSEMDEEKEIDGSMNLENGGDQTIMELRKDLIDLNL